MRAATGGAIPPRQKRAGPRYVTAAHGQGGTLEARANPRHHCWAGCIPISTGQLPSRRTPERESVASATRVRCLAGKGAGSCALGSANRSCRPTSPTVLNATAVRPGGSMEGQLQSRPEGLSPPQLGGRPASGMRLAAVRRVSVAQHAVQWCCLHRLRQCAGSRPLCRAHRSDRGSEDIVERTALPTPGEVLSPSAPRATPGSSQPRALPGDGAGSRGHGGARLPRPGGEHRLRRHPRGGRHDPDCRGTPRGMDQAYPREAPAAAAFDRPASKRQILRIVNRTGFIVAAQRRPAQRRAPSLTG